MCTIDQCDFFEMSETSTKHELANEQLAAAQEVLRVSEQRYRAAFETSLDAIAICRMDDGMFVDVNRQFFSILGYCREELVGQTSEESYTWTDTDGENHSGEFLDISGKSSHDLNIWENPRDWEQLTATLRNESVCRHLEIKLRKKNGDLIWAEISASVIELEAVPCVLFVTRDISSSRAAAEAIHNLSMYDGLTCLPNRRQLLERLQTYSVSKAEHGNSALLSINLDAFRTVNESYGSAIGDQVLQESARRILSCVRDGDLVARSSGDEFSVILAHLSMTAEQAAAKARSIAQRILTALEEPYSLEGRDCRCTASIGITIFDSQGLSAEDILQQSDIAVDHAKEAGCNTMRFFAPALQAAINQRNSIEIDLRAAIENGQFILYYQPQVHGNELIGAEALVRWQHPTRGLLAPGEFISLAEETGLIVPLGAWVLEEACRQTSTWAASRKYAQISISINVSARQFREPNFVRDVLETLSRTGANPHNIVLELTESTLVSDVEQVVARMSELKTYGLRFSVDDFGTGYSSLSYLQRLPIDKLKIDISFVRRLLIDPSSSAIANAIISLARALDLEVIAEGVECEEQRNSLARMGCHFFQGYLIGRPAPVSQFEAMMANFAVANL
jgi:diguanylate cyclase (GGDEF)-like protein